MVTTKLTCRVCGKLYDGCRCARLTDGTFRWQSVACSPECGEIYLDAILKSRMPQEETSAHTITGTTVENTKSVTQKKSRKVKAQENSTVE